MGGGSGFAGGVLLPPGPSLLVALPFPRLGSTTPRQPSVSTLLCVWFHRGCARREGACVRAERGWVAKYKWKGIPKREKGDRPGRAGASFGEAPQTHRRFSAPPSRAWRLPASPTAPFLAPAKVRSLGPGAEPSSPKQRASERAERARRRREGGGGGESLQRQQAGSLDSSFALGWKWKLSGAESKTGGIAGNEGAFGFPQPLCQAATKSCPALPCPAIQATPLAPFRSAAAAPAQTSWPSAGAHAQPASQPPASCRLPLACLRTAAGKPKEALW